MIVRIDNVIKYSAGIFMPKIIFLLLKWTSKEGGAAIITSRLKDISFNIGMEEGIGVFVLLGILFYKLSEHYIEKHFKNKIEIEQLQENFLTQDIINQIDTYPISKSLNLKLKAIYVLKDY